MVKKKAETSPTPGWGAEAPPSISADPENRQPLDEGWDKLGSKVRPEYVERPDSAPPTTPKSKKAAKPEEPAPAGHNNPPEIIGFVERVERLMEERDVINGDIKEVLAEAKANGFDVPIMRKVLARRRMDDDKRSDMDALIDLYESQLGMR